MTMPIDTAEGTVRLTTASGAQIWIRLEQTGYSMQCNSAAKKTMTREELQELAQAIIRVLAMGRLS